MEKPIIREHTVLACGAVISVQAGAYHYSEPRKRLPNLSDYTSVEMRVISGGDDLDYQDIEAYKEVEDFDWNRDVFAYVPVEALTKFIERNGGVG